MCLVFLWCLMSERVGKVRVSLDLSFKKSCEVSSQLVTELGLYLKKHWLCCRLLHNVNVMKTDQSSPSFPFHFVRFCCVTHGVNVGNISDQKEDDTVPLLATADCSFDLIQPLDTRSYCTPRSGHLDFDVGRQTGKKGQGKKREGGNYESQLALRCSFLLQNGKHAAQDRCYWNSRRVSFKWRNREYPWFKSELFFFKSKWCMVPVPFDFQCDLVSRKAHSVQTKSQNTFPCQYILSLKSWSWHHLLPKVESYHLELLAPNIWPVPWHATLSIQGQTVALHHETYVLLYNIWPTCHGDLLHKPAEVEVVCIASAPPAIR